MYQVVGLRESGRLRVIDSVKGTLEKNINLYDLGLNHEPEAVFFHDGELFVSFWEEGKTTIYRIAPSVYR